MASLNGQTPADTYEGLLKTNDNSTIPYSGNAPAEVITDGAGNASDLKLHQNYVEIGRLRTFFGFGDDGKYLGSNSQGVLNWKDGELVPSGGTINQVLTKDSNTDYDYSWQSANELPINFVNTSGAPKVSFDANGNITTNGNMIVTDIAAQNDITIDGELFLTDIRFQSGQSTILLSSAAGGVLFSLSSLGDLAVSNDITASGDITAQGDVYAYSDARVKENVKPIENALNKVKQLQGVTYTRNDIEDDTTKVGFIAQEVKKVLPEVVSLQVDGDVEDRHVLDYAKMVAVLTEAIKEQQKQIDELKSQLK